MRQIICQYSVSVFVPFDIAGCYVQLCCVSTLFADQRRFIFRPFLTGIITRDAWKTTQFRDEAAELVIVVSRDLVFHRKVVDSGTNQGRMVGCLEHANRPKNDLWLIATTNTHSIDFALLKETFARCTLFVDSCRLANNGIAQIRTTKIQSKSFSLAFWFVVGWLTNVEWER